ncbi:MAG: hypothetical protein ACKO15_11605, partial [Burkholderiales bacterium]
MSSGSPESSWIGAVGDWLAACRNALLTNSRFQFWATRFPLTQRLANRRARAVFDLVAGFVYSQILLACVQLRVFEYLKDGPIDSITLAGK